LTVCSVSASSLSPEIRTRRPLPRRPPGARLWVVRSFWAESFRALSSTVASPLLVIHSLGFLPLCVRWPLLRPAPLPMSPCPRLCPRASRCRPTPRARSLGSPGIGRAMLAGRGRSARSSSPTSLRRRLLAFRPFNGRRVATCAYYRSSSNSPRDSSSSSSVTCSTAKWAMSRFTSSPNSSLRPISTLA
jgi:hypothetical protein